MELSEEEKKAIEYFKRRIANKKTDYTNIYFKIEKLELLLNLIKKQQKEIEELKEKDKEKKAISQAIIKDTFIDRYISKGKIREIFQFYIERDSLFTDDPHKMAVITLKDVLEELLKENTNE